MADEKKKPWQFSLARALGAMTVICITLGVAVPLRNNKITIIFFSGIHLIPYLFVAMLGLVSAIGTLTHGIKGAVVGAAAVFIFCAITVLLIFIAINFWK